MLNRQSARTSAAPFPHASLDFLSSSFHDLLYLRAGRLRNGAILRRDQTGPFPTLNPVQFRPDPPRSPSIRPRLTSDQFGCLPLSA